MARENFGIFKVCYFAVDKVLVPFPFACPRVGCWYRVCGHELAVRPLLLRASEYLVMVVVVQELDCLVFLVYFIC